MQPAERSRVVAEQYGSTTARLDARVALHRDYSTAAVSWQEWLFGRLDLTQVGTLIEVGAGTGALWQDNRDRLPAGLRLMLTDLSPAMCRQLHDLRLPRSAVARADAMRLPFADGVADAVVANHMLYHVPSPDDALREIARLLRPDGVVYAATNGRGHMRELEQLAEAVGVAYGSMRLHHPFLLEEAPERMTRHFPSVELAVFDDDLAVTASQPLIDYLASVVELSEEQRDRLDELVLDAVRSDGAFTIRKSVGLITARA